MKTLTNSNYHRVQYFLLKLRTRFLLTNVYKRVFVIFFLLFRSFFFLQISWFNFSLKLCWRPKSYKQCQTNQVRRSLEQVRSKKLLPWTIMDKIFETNSTFHVIAYYGKSSISIFQEFLQVLTKLSFLEEH